MERSRNMSLSEEATMNVETNASVCDKGKAIPLQAWKNPEGSRRMRLPDFKTIGT
jgi:hypothetical protein